MNRFIATLLTYLPIGRRKAPSLKVGKTQTGYGRVNNWVKCSTSTLRKDLVECAANGLTCYHIEYACWAGDFWTNKKTRQKTQDRYEWLVKRCRALGLWLFVSITNDNMGHGKYGDKSPLLEKVLPIAYEACDFIKKQGKDNVLVQPVAETQTSGGKNVENYCKQKLSGFQLVSNGNGGQPSGTGGMNFAAYHPSSIAKVASIPSGFINSSDHGLIIRELGEGLDGPGKPDKLKAFVEASKKKGHPLCVYYAFQHAKHDAKAIKAMKP